MAAQSGKIPGFFSQCPGVLQYGQGFFVMPDSLIGMR